MTPGRAPVAGWVPPALLEAPGDPPGTPRLLEALLAAVDRQRIALAADIDRVWEDLFIESCDDWAVPYVGALVGLPPEAGRLEVAYAIALRRRKGTPRALEDFARVLTGWTARAQEGWRLVAAAQRLGGAQRPAALDLRGRGEQAPSAPPRSMTPGGVIAPCAAGVLLWPWRLRTLHAVQAVSLGSRRYALHPFKLSAPLYVRPPAGAVVAAAGTAPSSAEPVPPIRATYRALEALAGDGDLTYGPAWRLAGTHPLASAAGASDAPLISVTVAGRAIGWDQLRFTSITPATPDPDPGQVLVDVARGLLLVAGDLGTGVRATWHRPVSGAIGAVAADARRDLAAQVVVAINRDRNLQAAIAAADEASKGLTPTPDPDGVDVEIRLETSDAVAAPGPLSFTPRLPRWRIVAPTLMTPTVTGALTLNLKGCSLTLEGFLLDGDLTLGADLAAVRLDGITMNVAAPRTLSVSADAWTLAVAARRCILGPLRADLTATPIRLEDCVVDGLGQPLTTCGDAVPVRTAAPAVARSKRFAPILAAAGCTFSGVVDVEAVDAQDCIFADGVTVLRQQEGCLRHCHLGPPTTPPAAHPTTHRCLTTPAPRFVSRAFESGGYYALDLAGDQPLLSAATDGGEIGAYRHARRAVALARLRQRIGDFVPLGLRAAVTLADWEE